MMNEMLDTRIAEVHDQKDRKHLETVKSRNEQLRLRFLNPRLRMVGRDVDALHMQMKEREEAKRRVREEDVAYGRHVADMDILLRREELKQREQKARLNAENKVAWDEHALQNKARREQEAAEERAPYVDGQPGVGAAQRFDGEDPGLEERRAIQAAQLRKWTREQQQIKVERREAEWNEELDYAENVRNMVDFTEKVEQEQRKARMALQVKYREDNRAIAEKIRQDLAAAKKNDLERIRQEIEADTGGRLKLDENTTSRTRRDNPNRYLKDGFKGLDKKLVHDYYLDQRKQVLEKQLTEEQRLHDERVWAKQQEQSLQKACEVVYNHKQAKKKLENDCFEVQRQQMEERRQRKLEQDRFDRSPAFTSSFFERFGQSHR